MTGQRDYEIFEPGDVTLQSGAVFPAMKLAYKTWGTLSPAKDNVILYPTSFSAQHFDTEWLIGPEGVLDPTRYFIIIPNLFGNGLSSSPSNTLVPFPEITYHDAVAVQHRLLTERFGITKLALVYGWSMGGMQTYHWAALHPDMVARAAVVCGSARCAPYNHVFLESVKAALSADPAFRDGRFVEKPVAGYRAMGRVYAGWAMSHGFIATSSGARRALPRSRIISSATGTRPSPAATPTISWRRPASGNAAISANARPSAAISIARSPRSRRICC